MQCWKEQSSKCRATFTSTYGSWIPKRDGPRGPAVSGSAPQTYSHSRMPSPTASRDPFPPISRAATGRTAKFDSLATYFSGTLSALVHAKAPVWGVLRSADRLLAAVFPTTLEGHPTEMPSPPFPPAVFPLTVLIDVARIPVPPLLSAILSCTRL